MTISDSTILMVIFLLAIAIIFWWFLFRPIFKVMGQISIVIRKKIEQDIHTSHNTITTLSASAIVLSFSSIEVFSINCVSHTEIISFSWFWFLITVLLGMVIGILNYTEKTMTNVSINLMVKASDAAKEGVEKNKLFNEKEKQVLSISSEKRKKFRISRFIFLYCQAVSLVIATTLFTVFAIANVIFG